VHEVVQTAVGFDPVGARTEHQMEGIGDDELGTASLELLRGHRFDRRIGADRHEHRRLDGAAGKMHAPPARRAVPGDELEAHAAHASLAVKNMTSP
jgi:hypothetical protein